jgi:hypothetical protein
VDYQEAGWFKMMVKLLILFTFVFGIGLNGQIPVPGAQLGTKIIDGVDILDENSSSIPILVKRSSEEETIERARVDLKNREVGRRVGAAKLLGKYRSTTTSMLLISALDDSSALVRRAVMVSLAEHASNGFYIYDKTLVEKIYSKLGDPDVEVRREVSTMIPRMITGMMRSRMEVIEINGRKVYRSAPSKMRPDLYKMTQDAFLDKDAIVRQNVLKYHSYLKVSLPLLTLEKLLTDSDIGVLLTALERISSNASQSIILNRVKELSRHKNKGIRLKVVATARNANSYHPGYRGILREMTRDSDSEVLSMAAVELARFGERVPAQVIEEIKKFLLGVNGLSTQVTTILYTVSALGVDGIGVYRALTEHSSSQIRTIAWQRFINLSDGWKDSSIWLPATKDPDKEVRQVVLNTLRGRTNDLSENELSILVESKFPDVRIFAAQSLLNAKLGAVEALGFDLLIDEDTIVRSTTIRAMSTRRVPGWLNIMNRSLLDDNYVIQRAAMDGLLEDKKEGVPILLEYISRNPQSRISHLARNELSRLGVQP